MNNRNLTKTTMLTLIFILIFSMLAFPVKAEKSECLSWYCMRTKDHKRPTLPSEFGFINEYNGWFLGSDQDDKVVYLTFDAGYENGNVEKVLETLDRENVKGAFFILSNLIDRNTELVCRMFEGGHTVCNHTSKHRNMSGYSMDEIKSELETVEKMCFERTGHEMSKYFRPPEGKFSRQMMNWLDDLGYKTVFWSFAYADWDNGKQPDTASAKKKILDNIHPGAVLLLHPTSATNAEILGDVIRELKNSGYRFGTLDELTAK